MAEVRVKCPKCGHSFAVSEALARELEAGIRKDYEDKAKTRERELRASHQEEIAEAKRKAAKTAEDAAKKNFDSRLRLEVEKQKTSLAAAAMESARRSVTDEIQALRNTAKKAQARTRELEEAAEEVDRRVEDLNRRERTLKSSLEKAREQGARATAETYRQQELEHNKIVTDLKKQLTETRNRLDKQSQQLQGEVRELELEDLLRRSCPEDRIRAVKAGTRGADVIQGIVNAGGEICGSIVWEMKNAKNWSTTWIPKLKSDQRKIKAEVAVLVSRVLPPALESAFGFVDGVWVCSLPVVAGVALALRQNLIDVAALRRGNEGKDERMEAIYQYVMSPGFRQRVEAVVECFQNLAKDHQKEKAAMENIWAKREAQLATLLRSVAGMVGDIQGITPAFPSIRRLELPPPA